MYACAIMRDAGFQPGVSKQRQPLKEVNVSASNRTAQIEYRSIPGFPAYRIGSDGSLWSQWKRTPFLGYSLSGEWARLTTPSRDKDGYVKVILCSGKGAPKRHARLHILVLEAFCGLRLPGQVGCHNNGDKTDNDLENLRWDTQKGNIADKERHGTKQIGDKSSKRVLSENDVVEIRLRRDAGERNCDLAAEYGVSQSTTSAAYVGRNWSHFEGRKQSNAKAAEVLITSERQGLFE